MAVFESKDAISHIPTTAQQVFDVTGAGDTVIAVLALASACGLPLVSACLLANYAAGIVVGNVGAATVSPNQLAEAIATLPAPAINNWDSNNAKTKT
jgi:bifunctional ADP-heptose synthase (sugar kinase/adenylyltransferase)